MRLNLQKNIQNLLLLLVFYIFVTPVGKLIKFFRLKLVRSKKKFSNWKIIKNRKFSPMTNVY